MKREGGFCWYDGFFHRETEVPVHANLFNTAVVVSEAVRTLGSRLAFFPDHYENLRSRLAILDIHLPEILTAAQMHQHAVNLINKNRYFGGNYLRITIIHEPGQAGANHCLMENIALEDPVYVLNRKGYVLGLYDDLNIQLDRLTGKFAPPPMLDVFARRYIRSRSLDDCFLFNQLGHITGSLFSVIFFRIGDKIHTPPARDGSTMSVMRAQVIRLLKSVGEQVSEKLSLRSQDIENADEIFLANTLDGIRWVVAVDRSRYYNHTSVKLITALNEEAFGGFNSGPDSQEN
jgi:branched-chain amino acid aminotransferase